MECAMALVSSTRGAAAPFAALSQKTSLQYSRGVVCTNFPLRTAFLKLDIHRGGKSGFRKKWCHIRSLVVRASGNEPDNATPIASFQPESPTGQYLTQLLQSHPHLVPAAIQQELEKLAKNRNSQDASTQPSSKGSELVLYRDLQNVVLFIIKQPKEFRHLEFPSLQTAGRLAILTIAVVMVLIVLLATVDSALSFIVASVFRRIR